MRVVVLASLTVALSGLSLPLHAYEWFQTEGVNCSGPQSLGDAISAFTGGGLHLEAGKGPGKFFVRQSPPLNIGKDQFKDVRQLDPQAAKSLASRFLISADSTKIPSFLNVGTSIATGLLLPPVVGTGAGLIFNHFFELDECRVSQHP